MYRIAVALALYASSIRLVYATPLVCPMDLPPTTLTMACSASCPNALSPCLYYPNTTNCVASAESGSVCVSSTLTTGNCAIECFSPFSGTANDSWNLMITTEGEYKQDVVDHQAHDPTFHVAKKNVVQLSAIRDLTFPPTTKTISISGDALPILDKAVDYPVIYNGQAVMLDMGNFSFLQHAQNVTTILLENINLTALTEFPLLPKLTALQLANGNLHAIPRGIAKLPALQRLEVSLTMLVTIPDTLLPMNLVDLCLQDSGLIELPRAVANMTNLKKLDLSGNKFPLPSAGSLPLQVEHLIWWGLYHRRLPPDFPKMTKLKILEMGWNDFADASALSLLPTSLEELHLIDVLMTELPTAFSELKNLTWIELGKNSIKRVTKDTVPPNVKFLNLSINFIDEIQASALPSCLETLDLRFNMLTCSSFPTDFTSIQGLTTLYLHENQLTCIPPAIFTFKKLQRLTLHRNANMTRLTLNDTQVAFLGQLKTFTIEQSGLETNCNQPRSIGSTNYTVCLTGDTSINNKTSTTNKSHGGSSSNYTPLIIGLAVALGGLLAILIGAVHWKRRHDATNSVQQPAYDSKSSLYPLRATELHALEEQFRGDEGASDATSYAEMTHASLAYKSSISTTSYEGSIHKKTKITKTVTTTTTTTGTSDEMTSRFSVWDDAELLQWRIDFAAIRDVELLSSGMYGEVWLGIYMSRHVAIKRLKKTPSGRGGVAITGDETDEQASTHRKTIQQFASEIKIHSRMDHPKIVKFIGVAWTMESDLQAVVEYMEVGDLRTFLSSLQPTFETLDDDDAYEHHWDTMAVHLALDIAEALVYLHSLDPPVLHRDLKSRNILLDEALGGKVSDFGVSRYHFDDDTHIHMTTNMSTARWAAPEVLTGSDANYTSAIDIYSLGIILSELDTWAIPFAEHVGVADSALLSKVIAGELLPRFQTSSPPDIVALAKSCLATNPKKRPTAVTVAYTLRQCLTKCDSDQARVHGLATANRSSRGSVTATGTSIEASL